MQKNLIFRLLMTYTKNSYSALKSDAKNQIFRLSMSCTFNQKWSCYIFFGKCKIFLMAVYLIFKYGKRWSAIV